MSLGLGGPGVACSAMRVRRLAAGELAGDEQVRTELHVAGCERCRSVQHELARERARLEAELPFETFAAGIAERLARPAPRRTVPRAAAFALAASVAFALAVPVLLRVTDRSGETRIKGGAELVLYVREDERARPLAPAEPVPAGRALRIGLSPAGRRFAAVALLDADGPVVLYAGPAEDGVLPGAFEWTGREGALVLVLDDAPVDTTALAERLSRGGPGAASPGGRSEVVVRRLRRAAP